MSSALVLVVDDSPTQALQIRLLLQEAGYLVATVGNGRAALEEIHRRTPDVVVTDLAMPEMNGLELVQAIVRDFPRLPVVLTTAKGSEEIAADALRNGAASYVPKRSLDDLAPTLQRLLALRRASRDQEQLWEHLEYQELRYRLNNDDRITVPLVAHLQSLVERHRICDELGAAQVATAVDEALVNAMIHGNLEVASSLREVDGGQGYLRLVEERRRLSPFQERHVFVNVSLSREQVEFRIRDDGPGFNPSSIPNPTAPENLEKISGRGLMLIHAFMDEVRHNEQGNEIVMLKRRMSV